ncbi:hypothetical protein [Streptomyces sp. NPDC001661]
MTELTRLRGVPSGARASRPAPVPQPPATPRRHRDLRRSLPLLPSVGLLAVFFVGPVA